MCSEFTFATTFFPSSMYPTNASCHHHTYQTNPIVVVVSWRGLGLVGVGWQLVLVVVLESVCVGWYWWVLAGILSWNCFVLVSIRLCWLVAKLVLIDIG